MTLGAAVLATCLGIVGVETRPGTRAAARMGTEAFPADDQTKSITIKKDAVIGVRLDRALTTESARANDRVTARIARDVMVDDRAALVAGTRVEGYVAAVERGSRSNDRVRIGIRFTTLILTDDRKVPIQVDPVYRESEPATDTTSTGANSVLSAFLSSSRGRTPPPSGPGSTSTAASAGRDVRIPAGSLLTMKLTANVTIER